DTSLVGLAKFAPSLNLDVALEEIEKSVNQALKEFDGRGPSKVIEPHVVPALRNLRAVIRNVAAADLDSAAKYELLFRLRNKESEFVHAVELLAGIVFEAGSLTNRGHVRLEDVVLNRKRVSESLGYNERVTNQSAPLERKSTAAFTIGDVAFGLEKP